MGPPLPLLEPGSKLKRGRGWLARSAGLSAVVGILEGDLPTVILLGFGQLGCTLRSSQKMPLTVTLLPGHDLAEEWERKESFLCAERCVCVTRCPRIILTQRRAGKCFWGFFFLFPAHVAPRRPRWAQLNGGLVRGRGGAGRGARPRAAPSPSPHPAAWRQQLRAPASQP